MAHNTALWKSHSVFGKYMMEVGIGEISQILQKPISGTSLGDIVSRLMRALRNS